jgi:methyl-accepting chemotaxis protein
VRKVNSVNSLLAIQIAAIVAPLALALIYQTASNGVRARELERVFLVNETASNARSHYGTFKNSAADAIDSGRLSAASLDALASAQSDLIKLSDLSQEDGLGGAKAKVESMMLALRRDATVAVLSTLRSDIGSVDQYINGVARKYDEANDATIHNYLDETHRHIWIMSGIGLLTSLIIAICVVRMMRSVSSPLARAQAVAGAIAGGTLHMEASWTKEKDLGGLLESLGAMNNGLREIVWRTKQAVETVGSATSTVSAQAQAVRELADQQSGWVGVTRASLNDMKTSITNVGDGASATLAVAEHVQSVAKQGSAKMAENQEATQRIIETVDTSANAINALSKSITRIADVTNMIKDIADQTNLLALNAAIEAARAGEQGRGFAVVADEVRKLAERTTTSTADIAAMVQTINTETAQVVAAMASAKQEVQLGAEHSRSTGDYLTQIVTAAEEVFSATRKINSISAAQQATSVQAIDNMDQIARLAELNVSKLQEVSGGIESLQRTAAQLAGTIGKFTIV